MIKKQIIIAIMILLAIQSIAIGTEKITRGEANYRRAIENCSRYSYKFPDGSITSSILGLKNGYCHVELVINYLNMSTQTVGMPTTILTCKIPQEMMSDLIYLSKIDNENEIPPELKTKIQEINTKYCTTTIR